MDKTVLLFRISKLIAREKIDELSPEENLTLQAWLNADEKNRHLYHSLKDDKILAESILQMEKYETDKQYKRISKRLKFEPKAKPVIRIPAIYKYAAAVFFLITGIYVAYTIFNPVTTSRHAISQIQPGTQKAVLTTSDNRQIALGNREHKSIFIERNAILVDTGSTLTYRIKDDAEAKETELEEENYMAYNQLETTTGGEYTLILPDGSKVKLNSQTRLRFPVPFDKNSRLVELEGEAFFDVVESEAVPFIVNTVEMKITVYGTAFNVSAYRNDTYIQTTLVKGSIGVSLPRNNKPVELKLKPGQQACYHKTLNVMETKEVNIQQYTAWTKGLFVFENEPLEQILQKLARWYDCEIEFRDESLKTEPFTGELKRFDSFSKILDMIAIASDVGFKMEGKKIIVVPEK